MTADQRRDRIHQLLSEIANAHAIAALCVEEIRSLFEVGPSAASPTPGRPWLDTSRFRVSWRGKCCDLGCTILFRLLERLARRPGQYVAHDQLLREVWDGHVRSPDTLRSGVRHLKRKLAAAGMGKLAEAIKGQGSRYGLMLHPTR